MAAPVTRNSTEELYELLRRSRWDDVIEACRQELPHGERGNPGVRLALAIALMRTGSTAAGMEMLKAGAIDSPDARTHIRRHLVRWLLEQGDPERAGEMLQLLVEADPDSTEDLRLGASVLGRLKRWDVALDYARRVIELNPDDLPGHTSYLQLLLQSGRVDEAGEHARSLGDMATEHPKLGAMALLSLTRSGQVEAAGQVASAIDESRVADGQLASYIVRALYEAGQAEQAVDAGERLLRADLDHPQLRSFLGQAYLQSYRPDRYEHAIEHLREGLDLAPDDWRMNSAMGEALLRSRSYKEAIPFLAKACERQPKAAQTRALYARALKQAGHYAEAAHEFRRLLELEPSSPRWQRYAAGALSQAGLRKEAAAVFDAFVEQRRATLPRRFEDGLKALWDKVDEVDIPQARLDWAWELRDVRINDRAEWERRAKWGHLADHDLLDWLECRDDRVHDAMLRLADLSSAEEVLGALDPRKGVVLASAHIGPMYAGPLALELLGVRSKWLASTPSVARTAYASSLISTSDQDDLHVAKAVMDSLRKGVSVVLAVDGAINLGAPRIPFAGQEITYSSFAARTAHRIGVQSLFCAPRWEGDKIGFVLRQLPDPLPDEDAESHAARWRDAYLRELREYLGGEPENLRLSGGIWRHIR